GGAGAGLATARAMSSRWARCVAGQGALWRGGPGGTVVGCGAGSGALAAQVLGALHETGSAPAEYAIVELSAGLRDRQRRTIGAAVPQLLERVRWLDALPERIEGVVLANELRDAMPVRVFRCVADDAF